MNSGKIGFKADTELPEEEYLEILNTLNEYSVKFPPEYLVQSTMNILQQFVPQKKNTLSRLKEKSSALFFAALRESVLISWQYWSFCAVLFILGFILIVMVNVNHFTAAMFLSPIPFVVGLIEVLRGRDQGMTELESTCKHSFREIILSRLLVTGIYSILLNGILASALSLAYPNTIFSRLVLMWLTPFSAVSSLSLWAAVYLKGIYGATSILSLWVSAVLIIQGIPELTELLVSLSFLTYAAIILAASILFFFGIQSLAAKQYSGRERWLNHGTNG